jgi:cysteine desulfurase
MSGPNRVYFDYNATAPMLECARDVVVETLSDSGNPSSVHHEGRQARKIVEAARSQVADLIEANPANVIFTSGATEAAMHALSPVVRAGGQEVAMSQLYVCETEHPCVLAGGRFAKENISTLPVHDNGLINLDTLSSVLGQHDVSTGLSLIAIQMANNETGIVQPIREISEIVHAHDGLLFVDAVQALGKVPVSIVNLGADFLIVSSHKVGGPQGAGALVLANGSQSPKPLIIGGGQENYHRGGTENVAAIAGFGAACAWHLQNLNKNIQKKQLRDSIEAGLGTISREAGNGVSQPVIFGGGVDRLPNTSCFSVPGVKAETALVSLDLDGVSVSSGSACSSGKVKQSHVLSAMGASDEEMAGALRVSVGWNSTEEEASRFLDAWKTIIGRMAA